MTGRHLCTMCGVREPQCQKQECPWLAIRTLRLWHWKQVVQARANMDADERKRVAASDKDVWAWDFHMGAVQTLNEFFQIGDTAARDLEASNKRSGK